jgi:predicted dehydrogenase
MRSRARPVRGKVDAVNVGVIGCGQHAQGVHLRILRTLPGVRVAAIAELDDAARRAASRLVPDASALADYDELLSRGDVEAVVVALPPARHAEAAIAALEAGKHVYLEKPIATTLADAEAVVRAWKRAGRIGMIGFNYRFNKLYREARELIGRGVLGEPIAVRSVFAMAAGPLPAWKTRRVTGGGVLLDLASHHVDLVRFLLNTEIRDISCDLQSRLTEDDTAFLRLRCVNGAAGQLFFSFCANDEDQFELYGTAGKLTVDRCHAMTVQRTRPASATRRADQFRYGRESLLQIGYGLARRRAFGHEPSWQMALECFTAAVRGQCAAEPDFDDGYRSLKIVLAAEEAALNSSLVTA